MYVSTTIILASNGSLDFFTALYFSSVCNISSRFSVVLIYRRIFRRTYNAAITTDTEDAAVRNVTEPPLAGWSEI